MAKKIFNPTDQWVYIGTPSGPDGMGGVAQALAAHAAMLPSNENGRIVYFSGSEWHEPKDWELFEQRFDPRLLPYARRELDHTRVFDCKTSEISNPGSPLGDLFCSGHAILPDGSLLIAGGTQHFPYSTEPPDPSAQTGPITQGDLHFEHWSGSRQTFIFKIPQDVLTNEGSAETIYQWITGPLLNRGPDNMGGGRWYPTLITLSNGAVFANCGHPLIANPSVIDGQPSPDTDYRHNNATPEIFNAYLFQWELIEKALGVQGAHNYAVFYPRLFIVPNSGDIFCVQPLYSTTVTLDNPNPYLAGTIDDVEPNYDVDPRDQSIFYNVVTQQIRRAFPGPPDPFYVNVLYNSQPSSAVMLPLLHEENYNAKILLCGGMQPLIADLGNDNGWQETAPRKAFYPQITTKGLQFHFPIRNFANLTLLPTGAVVLSGGVTEQTYAESDGIKSVEIYYPAFGDEPDKWVIGAASNETRGYHSTALLMADGSIWTAGSEWNDIDQKGTPNMAIELYQPIYYNIKNRVTIGYDAPSKLTYNENFNFTFASNQENVLVWRVVLIRLGSVTHSFNGDQRYISIAFEQNGFVINATAPPDGTVAPPGYYMLWIVDSNRLPCQLAKFVLIYQKNFVTRQPGGGEVEAPAKHRF